MPHSRSRRAALTATVTLLALSFAVIAAAAVAPGSISFTSATYQIGEGGGDALLTLSRSGGADGAVTAKVTLEGGTATGGVDYRRPSPGSVDPAFNTGTGPTSVVRDVAVQPDGRILIGGLFWSYNGITRNGLARLNADGSLDNTFPSPEMRKDVFCIVLQPDGKILIGGVVSQHGTNDNRTGIARLNADGSFDSTFTPGTGVGAYAVEAILLLPDGKILIGGNFPTYNGTAVGKLARLNPDGTLDTSFNAGAGPGGGMVLKLLSQPDGKIIVGGWFTTFAGSPRNGVARINADGSYDTGFNPGASIDNYNVTAIGLQPDGKVLVGGSFYSNMIPPGNPTALTRLNADGTPDATFPAPGYGTNFFTRAITIQPDGKILLGGSSRLSPSSDVSNWLDRRKADGTDDTTFNPGVVSYLNSGVYEIALQSDGKILLAGQFYINPFANAYRNLWRLEGDLFVTWNAGDTADKTVRLPVFQDTSHEENETVNLRVEALTGGATSGPVTDATLTITDDDPTLGFAAATYSVGEDGGSVSIAVERAGYTGGTSTFTYSLPFGTANASDFSHTPSVLTFAPGETTKTITIDITNDAVNERDETFSVQVGAVSGGTVSRHSAVVTILNDDPLPTVSIADTRVVEADAGTRTAVFTVTRTGLIDRNVVVNVRTADGTAVAGEDYVSVGVPTPTQLFIPPNAGSGSVTVSTYGDTIVEGDKTFTAEISTPVNATIARARAVGTIEDNDTSTGVPTVQFGAREFRAQEGAGVATLVVTRSGDSSFPMTVNYSTALWVGTPGPGSAWDRNDYTYTLGTLRFAAGETSKEVQIFITDDALVEGDELMLVALSAATGGASLGTPNAASVRIVDNDTAPAAANPVDDTAFFVRQHYRDFLGRDPDASGLAFWTNEIEGCGADAACREVKRVNVSAAFFLSIEFQETGYYVYLLYKAAFNSGERLPFSSFAFDGQQVRRDVVVGADGWEQQLASNKQAFADAFVARTSFLALYPQSLPAAQFVDALNANTGDPLNPTAGGSLTPAEREKLVADLTAGVITRAQALRSIAENAEYRRRQLNKAFVLMQYFGYLRRAPNAQPDVDFTGYNFWLGKLNEFGGNYINAEMVKAFISSAEYRKRFGQ